jgi:hypothetical protein
MRRGVEAGKGHHSKYTQSNLMVATFSEEVLSAYLCLSFPSSHSKRQCGQKRQSLKNPDQKTAYNEFPSFYKKNK